MRRGVEGCARANARNVSSENGQLREILKQYVDGVNVTEDALDSANPLVIVNGRVNLMRDPQVRLQCTEMCCSDPSPSPPVLTLLLSHRYAVGLQEVWWTRTTWSAPMPRNATAFEKQSLAHTHTERIGVVEENKLFLLAECVRGLLQRQTQKSVAIHRSSSSAIMSMAESCEPQHWQGQLDLTA